MSLECSECERDLRGGHDPSCSRAARKGAAPTSEGANGATLGERVRAGRKAQNWSLRELGRRADLSATFLCEVEGGKRSVGADTLFRLSQALGLPMDQLMQGATPRMAGVEVSLPTSLMRFARDADIPFRHALCCYWMQRTIMDHRIPSKRMNLELIDWLRFYEAVREWL